MKAKGSLFFLLTGFLIFLFSGQVFAELLCTDVYGKGQNRISLATGSPGELGLLKVLVEEFNKKMPLSVCWKKAGTGEALKLLKDKKVDMIMGHAPEAEKKAVAEGWASKRVLLGSNEFYVVGPVDDPAKITECKNVTEVYKKIATTKSKFFSRGDNSGTHKKEMEIWNKTGIVPQGEWYIITKAFMADTLKRANNEKGYFMTDSSTWIMMKKELPNLKVLFKGDKLLINVYHALCHSNCDPDASKFIDFLVSDNGQEIIRNFGKDKYEEAFYKDATSARKYEE
ncbi:substrate-binding domain-containing protein [Thermodesulfovibrio yellowstonii]|uniref:ABC transporter substrate-binding protein n=1 Tax=Thermodesulfovibrio yellowstonii TaxID=28262 RepID=A0A9W6LJI8_9BACT|nr:substrate-binding domain-containing protein [Thermodesulfovibrio islandicus]GLI52579.1 ABC transporter substrate-binding protein [Thermodesulfovibrio islandicus]